MKLIQRKTKCCDVGNRGFAIMTAVFVMVAMSVLAVGAIALISGGAQQMLDEYRTEQAFQVAQAGRAYVAAQLKGDADWSDNSDIASTSFNPGAFTATYISKALDTATVEVVGTVGDISRKMQQVFNRAGLAAWQNGIYTQQAISGGGSSTGNINGPVSAGGAVSCTCAACDATCPPCDPVVQVCFNGGVEQNNTNTLPTPNWAYWQSIASYVGNNPFPAGGVYPASGSAVYYDTNAADIPENTTINGTLVARGDFQSTRSNITINPAPGYPALIIDGNIKLNGCSNWNINGWVIAMGWIELLGTSDMAALGGFSATGNISFTGNTDIQLTFDAAKAPSEAGAGFTGGELAGGGEGKYIVFGLWQETF